MKFRKIFTLALCCAFIAIALLGCTRTTPVTVPITVTNGANDTYTLWIGHDETIRSSNDIIGGGSRMDSVTFDAKMASDVNPMKIDDQLKVHAAKNGKRIASQKLAIDMPYTEGMVITVVWDGKSFSLK